MLPKYIIIEIAKYGCAAELRILNKRFNKLLQPYWCRRHLRNYLNNIAAIKLLINNNLISNTEIHIILNGTNNAAVVKLIKQNYAVYIHPAWTWVVEGYNPIKPILYDIINKTCREKKWFPIRLRKIAPDIAEYIYKCAIIYIYPQCFNAIKYYVNKKYKVPRRKLIEISRINPQMYDEILYTGNYTRDIIYILRANKIPINEEKLKKGIKNWTELKPFDYLFLRRDFKSLIKIVKLHPISATIKLHKNII